MNIATTCQTHKVEKDVVEVVRCEDCVYYDKKLIWCDLNDTVMNKNDFCSYGVQNLDDNALER